MDHHAQAEAIVVERERQARRDAVAAEERRILAVEQDRVAEERRRAFALERSTRIDEAAVRALEDRFGRESARKLAGKLDVPFLVWRVDRTAICAVKAPALAGPLRAGRGQGQQIQMRMQAALNRGVGLPLIVQPRQFPKQLDGCERIMLVDPDNPDVRELR